MRYSGGSPSKNLNAAGRLETEIIFKFTIFSNLSVSVISSVEPARSIKLTGSKYTSPLLSLMFKPLVDSEP